MCNDETDKSPITGMSIREYPNEDDWKRILRDEAKTSPHREVEVES